MAKHVGKTITVVRGVSIMEGLLTAPLHVAHARATPRRILYHLIISICHAIVRYVNRRRKRWSYHRLLLLPLSLSIDYITTMPCAGSCIKRCSPSDSTPLRCATNGTQINVAPPRKTSRKRGIFSKSNHVTYTQRCVTLGLTTPCLSLCCICGKRKQSR